MTGFCNIQSDFGHAPDPRRLDHMVSGLVHGGCKPFQESRSRSHASTWRGLPPLCIGFALGHTYFRKTERISFNNSITVTVPIFWSWFTEGVFCPSGPYHSPNSSTNYGSNLDVLRVEICHETHGGPTSTFLTESSQCPKRW
jgi:hypothetical protein